MRLLKASTFEFEVFYGDAPPYAILSHTWGNTNEEATFQDLRDSVGSNKKGYVKIKDCCTRAIQDGLEYVWIDTCCIDKTNSVELQEAINSMFRWYKESTICYAFLSDYSERYLMSPNVSSLRESKWFTRGWTLQELIAPSRLLFYSQTWKLIGSKADLKDLISGTTRISAEVLAGQDLDKSSIAQRMSWASKRKTTRDEDMTYCLLGIFGVNLPLIYGEGGRAAFIRLQKAIMEESDDDSLFAWKQENGYLRQGFLATSPACFADSSAIVPAEKGWRWWSGDPYGMTNRGLSIKRFVTCTLDGGDHIVHLSCRDSEDGGGIGLWITSLDNGQYVRTCLDQLPKTASLKAKGFKHPYPLTLYVPQLYSAEKPDLRYVFKTTLESHNHYAFLAPSFSPEAGSPGSSPSSASTSRRFVTSFLKSKPPDAISRGFHIEASTSTFPEVEGNFSFTMRAGGEAGLLLKPSRMLSGTQYVVITFGVDFASGLHYRDMFEVPVDYPATKEPPEFGSIGDKRSEELKTAQAREFLEHAIRMHSRPEGFRSKPLNEQELVTRNKELQFQIVLSTTAPLQREGDVTLVSVFISYSKRQSKRAPDELT